MEESGMSSTLSEPRAPYAIEDEQIQELERLLDARQVAMFLALLREVLARGFGEVTLRVEGDRLFLVETKSYSGGKIARRRNENDRNV